MQPSFLLCLKCWNSLSFDPETAGTHVRCPTCGELTKISIEPTEPLPSIRSQCDSISAGVPAHGADVPANATSNESRASSPSDILSAVDHDPLNVGTVPARSSLTRTPTQASAPEPKQIAARQAARVRRAKPRIIRRPGRPADDWRAALLLATAIGIAGSVIATETEAAALVGYVSVFLVGALLLVAIVPLISERGAAAAVPQGLSLPIGRLALIAGCASVVIVVGWIAWPAEWTVAAQFGSSPRSALFVPIAVPPPATRPARAGEKTPKVLRIGSFTTHQLVRQFGADRVAAIHLTNAAALSDPVEPDLRTLLIDAVRRLGTASHASQASVQTSGTDAYVLLAPIDDVAALARLIDFGETQIDPITHSISVKFDVDRLRTAGR